VRNGVMPRSQCFDPLKRVDSTGFLLQRHAAFPTHSTRLGSVLSAQ